MCSLNSCEPDMRAARESGRQLSLFVLAVALGYSAYNYFSGDFGSLGFILRLTKSPMAHVWPVLRGMFVLQILVAIAALRFRRRPRALRLCSVSSISLAVVNQLVQIASCILLAFNPRVTQEGVVPPMAAAFAVLLIACLVYSVIATRQASKGRGSNRTTACFRSVQDLEESDQRSAGPAATSARSVSEGQ
jgi:hypothetical protein